MSRKWDKFSVMAPVRIEPPPQGSDNFTSSEMYCGFRIPQTATCRNCILLSITAKCIHSRLQHWFCPSQQSEVLSTCRHTVRMWILRAHSQSFVFCILVAELKCIHPLFQSSPSCFLLSARSRPMAAGAVGWPLNPQKSSRLQVERKQNWRCSRFKFFYAERNH